MVEQIRYACLSYIGDLNTDRSLVLALLGFRMVVWSTDGVNFTSIYFRLRKYKERSYYACIRLCNATMNILINPCTRSEESYEQLVVHD